MGVIKRQAFQSSVLLYLGTVIGFITTGLIAPNLLSKSEIGTLRLLLSYSGIFTGLGTLGFNTVTIRFLNQFYNKSTKTYHGFLGISILIGVIGSLLSLLIILWIEPKIVQNNIDKSPQFAHYFILILPLSIFQIYYTLFDSYNNALFRSSYGVFLRDFVQRMLILVGLTLVFLQFFSFDDYAYYYVFAICFPTVLIFAHVIWHKSFDIKIDFAFLKRSMVGSMFSVGVFGLLNSMSNMAALQIDAIMINMYLDDAAVGVYVITFYFGTLVFIPSKALNKIAPSLIAKAFKEQDKGTVQDIYFRSCQNLFLIGSLVYVGLLVNLDNVFNIIPKSYEEGKYVIVIIGLANLVKMAGGLNDSVITYSKYFKVTTLFLVIFTLIIIISNFIFIPSFGIVGAAIATLISVTLYNIMKVVFIKVKLGMIAYNFQFLWVILFSSAIYFIVTIIPDPGNFIVDIVVDSALTIALFYFIVRYLSIGRDLYELLHQLIFKALEIFKTKS